MWSVPLWTYPLIAACSWLAMLISMLAYWLEAGEPVYETMRGSRTFPFISDIGSQEPKPVFVFGSFLTMLFLSLSIILKQWPREKDQIVQRSRYTGPFCTYLSILSSIIGSMALVLSAVFDNNHYRTLHDNTSFIFITSFLLSGIFICADYIQVGIHSNWDHEVLVKITTVRLFIVIVELFLSLAFKWASLNTSTKHPSAILEWVVAFLFTGHILCFFVDLHPPFRTYLLYEYTSLPMSEIPF
ncbi:putative FK506 suppressor Sfk1 [Aspergillus campestris IBT 28561]|uniref:FK506 suppressor Sfk1 n=1 Tax=Aspergillus campestris (strain IBT 28561) TaxID=1392248 RepID=A0A2I1D2N3_ASPC2|nr:putative FK506 suppressor Sfk1 [Aspergillus campestris IBT 28561]PKY04124.1 putative FK506 suppressor Sfk1 [Aspergillus campestris IBT 28561]